jgi:hypothetical protein
LKGLTELAPRLPTKTHSAGVGIIRRAGRNRENAHAGCSDLVLSGRGGRDLGGCSGAGEDEDDNESTDEMFHNGIPLKLYLQIKISLDNQMR